MSKLILHSLLHRFIGMKRLLKPIYASKVNLIGSSTKNYLTWMQFKEIMRATLCPAEGCCGIQIPQNAWHTVEVKEPSVIFEAKDGPYKG